MRAPFTKLSSRITDRKTTMASWSFCSNGGRLFSSASLSSKAASCICLANTLIEPSPSCGRRRHDFEWRIDKYPRVLCLAELLRDLSFVDRRWIRIDDCRNSNTFIPSGRKMQLLLLFLPFKIFLELMQKREMKNPSHLAC